MFNWCQFDLLVLLTNFLDPAGHLLLHGDKLLITCILCRPLYELYKAVEGSQCQLEVLLLPVQYPHLPPHHLLWLLQQNLFTIVENNMEFFE